MQIKSAIEKLTESEDTLRPLSLGLLLLGSLIYTVVFIPIMTCAFVAPLFADTHQSHSIETLEVYFLVLYFVSFPLLIIGSLFFGWQKFIKKNYRVSIILSLLPIGYYFIYYLVEQLFDYTLKPLLMK